MRRSNRYPEWTQRRFATPAGRPRHRRSGREPFGRARIAGVRQMGAGAAAAGARLPPVQAALAAIASSTFSGVAGSEVMRTPTAL